MAGFIPSSPTPTTKHSGDKQDLSSTREVKFPRIETEIEKREIGSDVIDAIKVAVSHGDMTNAMQAIFELHYSDQALVLDAMKYDARAQLALSMHDGFDPRILNEVSYSTKVQLVEIFGYKKISELLFDVSNEDILSFLGHFSATEQLKILKATPPERRKEIRLALSYPERSAGRMMEVDYIVVTPEFSVKQVLDYIRVNESQLPNCLYDVFVVNEENEVVGKVAVLELLKATPEVNVASIMTVDFVGRINVLDDKREIAYIFNKYDLNTAPVLDEDNKLIGAISVDSVKYIADEQNTEELLKMSGVLSDLDEGFLNTTKIRFIWLLINLGTTALASWVISFFEHTISVITALAVLMPISVSMGCNAGTQTITVIIRALATKHLNRSNFNLYFNKEIGMAAINAAGFAFISIFAVYLIYHQMPLALVFGTAMFITIMVGALSGVFAPILMKALGTDPAVTAVVFLTTVTDIIAFLSFLGLAKAFLL